MQEIASLLTPSKLKLQDLLLDPNNPRFLDLGAQSGRTPDSRFNEPGVQRKALEQLKETRFDVASLRDTIKTIGFLPIDRIVVRRWQSADGRTTKYVVLEGNRRVAALNWLLELHEAGTEQLTPEQLENFTNLDVLVISDQADPRVGQWIVPGLRHVSGIKEWGAYQQAIAIKTLRESGMSPQEAAQSIGLSMRSANKLWRSFWALEQMRNDEEYGEMAQENLFSYFDELIKQPSLRAWFGWNDNERKFDQPEKIREFYGWITGGPDEEGEGTERKIERAIDVRDLAKIITEPRALAILRRSSLEDANATFKSIHPDDWRAYVANVDSMLAALSPDSLRRLSPEDMGSLVALQDRVQQVLRDRERLAGA